MDIWGIFALCVIGCFGLYVSQDEIDAIHPQLWVVPGDLALSDLPTN